MAEDQTTEEDIFTPTSDEDGSPDVSTTESQNEELDLGEESNNTSKQEDAKQAQLDGVYKKVKLGETSLDNLNKRQEWMKPYLEARLEAESQKEKKSKELDLDALLDEKLAAKEAEQRFQEMKSSLNNSDLTANQKAEISAEYKELRADGVSKDKALAKALKIAGVKAPTGKSALIPPRPNTVGTSPDEDVTDENFREKLPANDPRRIEYLEMMTDPTRARAKTLKIAKPVTFK